MKNGTELREFYDQLWQEAIGYFQSGRVQPDPFLLDRQNDKRRGLSVIARLSQEAIGQIQKMLDELKSIDPEQYYYQSNELHITVLSLFTATENYEPYMAHYSEYLSAVNAALSKVKRFRIQFSGVTASKGAVMVQGFPYNSHLDEIREGLRQKLRERGLVEGLDSRYRIRTAHSTVMRFQRQLVASERFIETLRIYRGMEFGVTVINQLELVKNDWYMSTDRVEVLERYSLS